MPYEMAERVKNRSCTPCVQFWLGTESRYRFVPCLYQSRFTVPLYVSREFDCIETPEGAGMNLKVASKLR